MTSVADARKAVFVRDGFQCVAPRIDPQAGQCYDKWGRWFSGYDPTGVHLEANRVQTEAGSRLANHRDPSTMITLCASHHRGTGPTGGYIWEAAHRDLQRDYLARHG